MNQEGTKQILGGDDAPFSDSRPGGGQYSLRDCQDWCYKDPGRYHHTACQWTRATGDCLAHTYDVNRRKALGNNDKLCLPMKPERKRRVVKSSQIFQIL